MCYSLWYNAPTMLPAGVRAPEVEFNKGSCISFRCKERLFWKGRMLLTIQFKKIYNSCVCSELRNYIFSRYVQAKVAFNLNSRIVVKMQPSEICPPLLRTAFPINALLPLLLCPHRAYWTINYLLHTNICTNLIESNLRGLSPRADYTNRAAAGRRS